MALIATETSVYTPESSRYPVSRSGSGASFSDDIERNESEVIKHARVSDYVPQQPIITTTKTPTTSKQSNELIVVCDWNPSRKRVNLSGVEISGNAVLQRVGKFAGVGGSVGSVVPGLGTAVGSVIGAAVGGVVSIFSKKEKDPRLIEHIESYFRDLFLQAFPNDPYKIGGFVSVDGNGKNALRLRNEYEAELMKQFIIESLKEFRSAVFGSGGIDSDERQAIDQVIQSVDFVSKAPSRGSKAILMSFKKSKTVAETANEEKETVSIDSQNRNKLIKSVATAAGVLLLSKFL